MPARTLDPKGGGGGYILMFQIGWGGERNLLYKGVETSS